MKKRPRILLATTNPAKLERLAWVVEGTGLDWRGLQPRDGPAPDEDGRSFLDNAELKARSWSERTADLVLASDGGMRVPALGAAWDPLRTGRAAGPGATDQERARHLLQAAAGLRGQARRVIWTEALAVARTGRVLASWERAETRALLVEDVDRESIQPGFWANTLCVIGPGGRTLADLDDDERARFDRNWALLREDFRAWWAQVRP